MDKEYEMGEEFAGNAVCGIAVGSAGKLEEVLSVGGMIKWRRIVSRLTDRELAVLSMGMTQKGRLFLLAGLKDKRMPKVIEMSKRLSTDDAVAVEKIAGKALKKMRHLR